MRALAASMFACLIVLATGCGGDDCADECGDPVDAAAAPDSPPGTPDAAPAPDANIVSTDYAMPANSFKETELSLAPGATIGVSFSSSAGAVEWNFHQHEGGQTTTLAEGTHAARVEQLTSPGGGPVWLMFRNPSGAPTTTVHVEIDLGDGATLVSW